LACSRSVFFARSRPFPSPLSSESAGAPLFPAQPSRPRLCPHVNPQILSAGAGLGVGCSSRARSCLSGSLTAPTGPVAHSTQHSLRPGGKQPSFLRSMRSPLAPDCFDPLVSDASPLSRGKRSRATDGGGVSQAGTSPIKGLILISMLTNRSAPPCTSH
jgi:hypothetical protein